MPFWELADEDVSRLPVRIVFDAVSLSDDGFQAIHAAHRLRLWCDAHLGANWWWEPLSAPGQGYVAFAFHFATDDDARRATEMHEHALHPARS